VSIGPGTPSALERKARTARIRAAGRGDKPPDGSAFALVALVILGSVLCAGIGAER
jgi:hypothetical protein